MINIQTQRMSRSSSLYVTYNQIAVVNTPSGTHMPLTLMLGTLLDVQTRVNFS